MTSTFMGTSRWETMATTTGTGPPSPGRPRPPPALTVVLPQPPRASRRAHVRTAKASCASVLPVFMGSAAFERPPAYRVEEGASSWPERLPGKHNYVQVYLDLTRGLTVR